MIEEKNICHLSYFICEINVIKEYKTFSYDGCQIYESLLVTIHLYYDTLILFFPKKMIPSNLESLSKCLFFSYVLPSMMMVNIVRNIMRARAIVSHRRRCHHHHHHKINEPFQSDLLKKQSLRL